MRRVKLSKRKQAEVNNLSWGRHNTLPSAVSVQVSTRGLKAAASRHEKLAGNTAAIVLYEVGRLLRKYPEFNAFSSDGAVYFYEEVNVGFAIDAGRGLKVPIIRNADTKSVLEIAEEMQDLLVSYLNDQINTGSLAGWNIHHHRPVRSERSDVSPVAQHATVRHIGDWSGVSAREVLSAFST